MAELDSFKNVVAGRSSAETQPPSGGVVPFVTEVCRYFMDFLETDFHKVRNPKRNIQHRNNNNLQISINLNRYKKYTSRAWRLIAEGFVGDTLSSVKRGDYTTEIPRSLLNLIQEQIKLISQDDVSKTIRLFSNEIDIGITKNPKDTIAAISGALDGISRVIRNDFINLFVDRIREPLEKFQTTTVDSIYQIEEELTDVLMHPFEDTVSIIINHIVLGKEIDREALLKQVFEIEDIKNKIDQFFNGLAAGDLFFEISELFNNKALLENQEFYFYFCDIAYKGQTYPLFYIPIQITKDQNGFAFTFDSLVYVNKKATQFVAQDYNIEIERKGSLHAFAERIIYLADEQKHFIGNVDRALKELVHYFGLDPYIIVSNPDRQVAKGPELQVSNSCYIGLFDKSDESLINDYEEILQKLKDGNSALGAAFKNLIDDFITTNPVPVTAEVEGDWDDAPVDEKLVYASPVSLNAEQRQILWALNKSQCKYVSVEGPPGTGKSHTITAIACEAVLKNQSILILSDKKEALDVVEDKITQTLNKVRLEENFQNPILRLGKAGNTYTKILSTTSMDRIKDHYRAVRTDYKKLEENISSSVKTAKKKIERTVDAYEKIKLSTIAEFERLEKELHADAQLPIDIIHDQISNSELQAIRGAMIAIGQFFAADRIITRTFTKYYQDNQRVAAFKSFDIFLTIAEELRTHLDRSRELLEKIRRPTEESLEALERYLAKCEELKSGLFGLLFKTRDIFVLNEELSRKLPNDFIKPQKRLDELRDLLSLFQKAQRLKRKHEFEDAFFIEQEFAKSIHELLTLDLDLPGKTGRKAIIDAVTAIEQFLKTHAQTAIKIDLNFENIFSYGNNALTSYPNKKFEKLVRYLELKHELEGEFSVIPEQNYMEQQEEISKLVTTEMTYKMDERVVNFYENYRNDAKSLAAVISKKQKFDRESFEKLKQTFPCILAGIRDFAEYIPLESDLFDLVIIDEASQVSIAQAFPALLRGKKIVVLGDKKQFSNVKSSQARSDTNREYRNQLRDVFVRTISDDVIKLSRLEKFNIKTSILEFSERISNFNIMLKKHFRGYRELISYSSKHFYNNDLQAIKIRAKPIDEVIRFNFVEHDGKPEKIENSNKLEIDAIIGEVEKIACEKPTQSIAIITPHTNQQKRLVDAFSKHPDNETFQHQNKLKIMTFDTCQGEERDIVLYSMVANPASDKLWGIFIKDLNSVDLEENGAIKAQRLNVGFSRAKERIHFFLSKPVGEFKGAICDALIHYQREIEHAKKLPDAGSTDARSPMEAKVLQWIQETPFYKDNKAAVELHAQFQLGEYIKQLDRRYEHPSYVVDFLMIYKDAELREHKIIIEYDGFEFHFDDRSSVGEFNYGEYYTDEHIYREKVLESYGYKFVRINRFNVGGDPIATLSSRLETLVKKKLQRGNSIVDGIHQKVDGLQTGSMKECPSCKSVKPLDAFRDTKLVKGIGRICNECKGKHEHKLTSLEVLQKAPKPEPPKTAAVLTDIKCPLCGAAMVLRTRRSDGHKFYGCSKWSPTRRGCKGTRQYFGT